MELGRLEQNENQEKKSKGITLKVESKEERTNDDSEEDETFTLLVKRLGMFFGKNDKSFNYENKKKYFKKREASTSTQDVPCYECGKQSHIKPDFPKLSKKEALKARRNSRIKRRMSHGKIIR